jgi:hypothetical protein
MLSLQSELYAVLTATSTPRWCGRPTIADYCDLFSPPSNATTTTATMTGIAVENM